MASDVNRGAIVTDAPEISREELRGRLRSPSLTIVDVLSAESYAAGHIPGALNLPLEQVASRALEVLPNRSAEIAVCCGNFT
jgi:rhodanese-related sulfurtransferase